MTKWEYAMLLVAFLITAAEIASLYQAQADLDRARCAAYGRSCK